MKTPNSTNMLNVHQLAGFFSELLIVSTPRIVSAEWIDHNGHMNVASYLRAFDDALGETLEALKIGDDLRRSHGLTVMTGQIHISYASEVLLGETIRIETVLLGCDGKRSHWAMAMRKGDADEIAATAEWLNLFVDQQSRRVFPVPDKISLRLRKTAEAMRQLPIQFSPIFTDQIKDVP